MKAKILVVDDEESIRFTFEHFLTVEGYHIVKADSYTSAVAELSSDVDLVVADIIMSDGTGIDLLQEIRARKFPCQTIIMTGQPNLETASQAVRLGAFDYLQKPVKKDELLHITRVALKHKQVVEQREGYRRNLEAVFRSIQDGIITVDKEGLVSAVNHAARRICAFESDIVGSSIRSLSLSCGAECLKALEETLDKQIPVEITGLECHGNNGETQVVHINVTPLLSGGTSANGAVMVIRDETRLHALERDLQDRQGFHRIVGRSRPMQNLYNLLESVADTTTTVLITGESGTGKELVAESLHYGSSRRKGPLVKVNCSALSDTLLESELFGHIRGAFTDAIRDRRGRFEEANGGTIFLDEIGDISPRLQVRLLRVLQEKTIERVGESVSRPLDVRIIAATNRDLVQKVESGSFREDLYYRLKVFQIEIPPLSQRTGDIPLLVDHFLAIFNSRLDRSVRGVSDEVLSRFMNHRWRGNVRELEHALEHAMILCQGPLVIPAHLPQDLQRCEEPMQGTTPRPTNEREQILNALLRAGGNKSKAARLLKMSVRTVYRKLEKYGIDEEQFEP